MNEWRTDEEMKGQEEDSFVTQLVYCHFGLIVFWQFGKL